MGFAGTANGGMNLNASEVLSPESSPTYVASQIVHDGGHFMQGFSMSASPVAQAAEEMRPLQLQRSSLEAMGAPESEKKYVDGLLKNPQPVVDYRNK